MVRQPRQARGAAPAPRGRTGWDERLLDAAAEVIAAHGYTGLTLERLAGAAGTSRMTLHRRGVTIDRVTVTMQARAADELQDALFPCLVSPEAADIRLEAALRAMFDVADRHLPLLAGLFADDRAVFHASPDDTGSLPTADVFVAPFVKLLADGERDGTLRPQANVPEAAVVLFNVAGWGYVQLRHAQRWPQDRAREGVLRLILAGLVAPRERS